jgi:hypothetical protein
MSQVRQEIPLKRHKLRPGIELHINRAVARAHVRNREME